MEGNTLNINELTPDAESVMVIAVIEGETHIAYSLDLSNNFDKMLDILKNAAILLNSEKDSIESSGNPKIH